MARGHIVALISAAVFAHGVAPASAKIQTLQKPGNGLYVLHDARPTTQVFPLAGTAVNAHVTGYVAQVAVKQRFNNPFRKALEAVYVFPLPQNAAVSSLRIRIGGRTITSVVKSRQEAKAIYDKARREGRIAARLDQERPNIFTQSIVNIEPGKDVLVELVYDVELRRDKQHYEFVYPMVVGPRYIPGKPTGKPSRGGGRSPDTTRVPDASRITPPILKPGAPSGHAINVEVTIDPGVPIHKPTSPTHTIVVSPANDAKRPHAVVVKLAPGDRVPNKDLVVRYRLRATKPRVAVIAHRGKQGGFFALMAHPPVRVTPAQLVARDLIFVVDTTGSMAGEGIASIKRALRYALRHLDRRDRFQIIRFASGTSELASTPLVASAANIRRGLSYVNGLQAAGSSELLTGLSAALKGRASAGRLRIVCLLTDGFVGNDAEVLAATRKTIGPGTRLFPIAVGSSVNRSLLERLAEVGRGVAHYILLREKPEQQIRALYARVRAPVLTNITVDWKGLDVKEVVPAAIPDVFAGQPLLVLGRYDRGGEATVVVRGKYAGADVSYAVAVSLPADEDGNDALGRLWARARIRQEMARSYRNRTAAAIKTITTLAGQFGLVTKYTSLVAEDKRVVNPGGKLRTYYVPVEMPEGVSYAAARGDGSSGSVTGLVSEPPPDVDAKAPPMKHGYKSSAGSVARAEVLVLSRRPGRWYVEGGFAAGLVSVETAEFATGFQGQLNLGVGRNVRADLRLGAELAVFLPQLETKFGSTHTLFRATYTGWLRGRLHVGAGLGLAIPFDDSVGVAFLATGSFRLPPLGPVLPALRVRYEGYHLPSNGHDMRSFTVGAEFGF